MAIEIDNVSRVTLGRFALKFNLALLIPYYMKTNYFQSASSCLALYAFWVGVIAMLTRQRFLAHSFNHWSEALWLAFTASGFYLAYLAAL